MGYTGGEEVEYLGQVEMTLEAGAGKALLYSILSHFFLVLTSLESTTSSVCSGGSPFYP